MSFNSFSFWFVFPFIFGLYWLIPAKYNLWRKIFLVFASYLLYMSWKPASAIILLGVSLITYWGGHLLENSDDTAGNNNRREKLVWLFVILGMLPLFVYKYYNFLNDSLSEGLAFIGLHFDMPGLNWVIPVGISFFTFQAVGYMLDVYHGRIKAESNILNYVLFVCFFPQITSGPISTAEELMQQIKAPHTFYYEQGKQGLKYLLWGMFIKLVIADRLGLFVDTVYANYANYSGSTCFIASIFYTLQIYCDFAGYSLMAMGIARTLGFNLINNFRRPYFAVSITDFWKRWHISLTRWLTRQVYIPLGGSRCSKLRNYWNILVTFLVSGIWHGANWTFILWGLIHGMLQITEKALGWKKYEGNNWAIRAVRIIITFILVNFAWVFFRMPNIGDAFMMLYRIVTDFGMPDLSVISGTSMIMLFTGLSILVFKDLRDEFFKNRLVFLNRKPIQWIIYIFLLCITLSFGVFDGGQFIYANF